MSDAPGIGFNGKLICLCSPNLTYCSHKKGQCPWWDREPVQPTWHRVPEDRAQ